MKSRFFFLLTILATLVAPQFVLADGGYVVDPIVSVPANAYTTFSMLKNGRRYYLGVDTISAKAATPKDTVTWYEEPSYATMWIAGPLWSSTGEILANKDYTRTIKSVWLAEKVNRDRYLAVGPDKGSYRPLMLKETGDMWHTEKDVQAHNKYINGYVFYYSDATGVEEYRYLNYDPVYGFGRVTEAKPSSSQRISVWDRKTGSDLVLKITPNSINFGWEPTATKTKQLITSQVSYYDNIDRFRSRFDQTDIYVSQSTPVSNPTILMASPYNLTGHYGWGTNPIDEGHPEDYNGKSYMPVYTTIIDKHGSGDPAEWTASLGWADSTVLYVNQANSHVVGNEWHDTVFAIGTSPIDQAGCRVLQKPEGGGAPTEGTYANHNDWLYIHFTCKGKEYKDSLHVIRQTFHNAPYSTLTTLANPSDHIFPYTYNNKLANGTTNVSVADTAYTFTVSGKYRSGNDVLSVANVTVQSTIGEEMTLNIANRNCYRDTLWIYDGEGNPVLDGENPTYSDIVLYDTLLVEALNIDGTPCDDWVSVRLTARNQIRVKVKQYNPDAIANRTAQIRYTYRYWHSGAEGDHVSDSRTIWITQEWSGAHDDELYTFHHKDTDADGLQAVHEKHNTFYAIPGENLNLPLHRDHWGYYRWFIYDDALKDRDLRNSGTWAYVVGGVPKNSMTTPTEFMPINPTNSAASRGVWDIKKDVATPTNPLFSEDHFTNYTATHIPTISYPESNTKAGKVACDVSAYLDVNTHGEEIGSLKELTEPTLSYRHVFDIQPAETRAEQMENVRGNGSGANWLETYNVVAPVSRAFLIQPQCPIADDGSAEIDEEHLQYIYYFNPTGTNDANMGVDPGSNHDKAATYCRVGKSKQTGDPLFHAKLMTLSEVLDNTDDTVFVVNPRRNGGYILGANEKGAKVYKSDILNDRTDATDLREHIEDDILNAGGSYDYYKVRLHKTGDKTITLTSLNYNSDLCAHVGIFSYSEGVDWSNTTIGNYSTSITVENYSSTSSDRITDINPSLVTMYMSSQNWLSSYYGYMTAYSMERRNRIYYYNNASTHLNGLGDDNAGGANTINQGWCFYKIIPPEEVVDHFETPRWERSYNGTTWTQVAHWDYSKNEGVADVSGYTMTADGALHIPSNIHATENQYVFYRLRTEHFQLAKFNMQIRSTENEMLNRGDIITENDIESDYNILYKLDMEDWPAPGTNDVVAYNEHFAWDFTEFSYHYPLSVIPGDHRVDTLQATPEGGGTMTAEMPAKGEYAFINKFVVPSRMMNTNNAGEEFECLEGAENGYMLCINSAQKRTTIMRFPFNKLSCSGQQIYLVCNYCNPVDNGFNPQITADLEGTTDGVNWTPIYRYISGEIPYNADGQRWYQMALPIGRDRIKGFTSFRCRAEVNGAPNKNAHLLIDRLRFIERSRGFSVFQNKATCIQDDSVTVLIRLDYLADTELYQPGKLVAYQFQKWDDTEGAYVPMLASKTTDGGATYTALTNTTTPKLEVFPGYYKDAFTTEESVTKTFLKTSSAHDDYGYLQIPEANYNPSNSTSAGGQSDVRSDLINAAITKLSLTGEAATARRALLDETGSIRTFEDVIAHDYNDFGTAGAPHIKSFVNEGTAENPHWVLYVVCRLPIDITENNTFRIGMTVMNNLDDSPTFSEEECATFHLLPVKQTTSLRLDGEAWPNYTRAEIEASPSDDKTLLPANETYRASVALQVSPTLHGKNTKNPRCQFDLLHATDDVREITTEGNAAFEAKYGCTRDEFIDAMETFRIDDERNEVRNEHDWSKVTPEDLTKTGRTLENATAIYNRLNKLINDGVLELGLDYRDIYMGDRANSYFYVMPVPASGQFELTNGNYNGTADTTMHASVCNDSLWLELHSEEPTAKLRFGYDSRIGDTYIVPVIRASATDANSALEVRVAESFTSSDAYTVVLGWEGTELVESNDPDWTAVDVFKYRQNIDVRTHAPKDVDYYDVDDVITFAPVAEGKTITLKAGYWYRFRAPFYAVQKSEVYASDPATPTGHSQFIVAVAPELVQWTPIDPDAANYWNDDNNWTPVMANTPVDGFKAKVPMGDTKVIIPQVSEGQLPILSDEVVDQKDTLHYGYKKNTCKEIYFQPYARMLGQEIMDYKKALVDVPLTSGSWLTFSPALDHIYSGDMYVPTDPATNDANAFLPGTFVQGAGAGPWTDNPRVWPYAVYQGFYNSSVPVAFYNTDEDGTPVNTTTAKSKNSVDWVETNVLDMHYKPGAACVLNIYGPSDADGEQIVVRLPKQESEYRGYGQNPSGSNYIAGPAITMQDGGTPRPAFADLEHNLAYDKTELGEADGITYTLTNEIESNIFFFGNPTMSLVDVYKLCEANASVLQHEEGTHHFTAYQLLDGSNYTVKPITGPGQYFIAPQRAVGLIASEPAKSLTIKLKPNAMVAITGDGTVVSRPEVKGGAPLRRMSKEEIATDNNNYLYIAASNEATDEWGGTTKSKAYITLGQNTSAQSGYKAGEDALNIASGLNYYSDYSFSTPLSMYTIADNKAMMLDVRDTIKNVPLVFATLDSKYTFSQYTTLSFALEGTWSEPLYLYDLVSGDSILIRNGLQIAIQTPQNDQIRYYINGRKTTQQDDDTPTAIDVIETNPNDSNHLSNNAAYVYDVLGHRVAVLNEYDMLSTLALPTGVYIIQRGNNVERVVIK